MDAPRNIRNTQYPLQIPVVTSEKEFEKLVPELGAIVLYYNSGVDTSYLRIGTLNYDNEIIWRQLELKDL